MNNLLTRPAIVTVGRDTPPSSFVPRGWTVAAFVLALELAMFGPLLGSGTVWLLDSPSYLLGPHPNVPSLPWSEAPWVAIRTPLEHALALVFRLLPWGPVRLLPLLLVPVLVALGFRRLFGDDRLATVSATLLFVVNPFVYERMMAGQLYFLLGVATLPLVTGLVVRPRNATRSGIGAGTLVAVGTVVAPHMAFVAGLLLLATIAGASIVARLGRIAHGSSPRGSEAATSARAGWIALGTALGLTSAWAIPAYLVASPDGFPVSDVAAFRTTADPAFGLTANVLGLYGFWREGWLLPKHLMPAWPLGTAAIVAVGVAGARRAWSLRGPGARTLLIGTGVTGALAIVLALGDRGPLGAAYTGLLELVPPFRIMREPQKFLALLVLASSVAFGLGVPVLAGSVRSPKGTSLRRRRAIVVAIALAVPCAVSITSFGGFAGAVRPAPLPASWGAADRTMGAGEGAVLILPWHRYVRFAWTQDRVVASPFASAFRRPVVMSPRAELADLTSTAADRRATIVDGLLPTAAASPRFGAELEALGIEYVVLAEVADWQRYLWLRNRDDVRPVGAWQDLQVFRVSTEGG